ncbi:dTDP-4-amino-4,6-dideoxygalactose transaminase [Albidovulum inexpectatum]|uniref:dTDP-4-amino-4,6-dideoxygalactose transaminase n=1 Tax=Albidovulum inexpectatum TaxID=196587 RepID=A0A2S5JHG6_9RHOB|nr:aminotransferase class I/II-fold pyridoxal phosphate-dependent enzyme [Albidovulum inexpectatum]PPB80954.1 dTDP-4-amino-4,6-dideoxygalactose transaminase [Albidovulum inexpectatum]
MNGKTFSGNFTQQEPIPEDAIAAATEVLRSGRLHRYNMVAGEEPHAALLEREYAAWQGARHCLATTSGGAALQIALRALGVRPGDRVLTNAFTLAPVPGAIHAVGAEPVLVDITPDLVIDLDDLARKATASGARVLMLSLMRGHLPDMDRVMDVATSHGLTVVEDCAHTMGARWDGRLSGSFGTIGCFSTQTYKHLNSGEGGLLVTDDPRIMARAIILSGSYMLYDRHGTPPEPEAFADARYEMPNLSARMDNLRAAILRPQLARLNDNIARWNERHAALEAILRTCPAIALPDRPDKALRVGSSIQFRLPGIDADAARSFVDATAARGVELKWFGAAEPAGYTSTWRSWRYLSPQSLTRTDKILSTLFDMRIPLTFSVADCQTIGEILVEEATALAAGARA